MTIDIFKRPAFWLVLYIFVLIWFGVMYGGTLTATSFPRVTSISDVSVGDETVSLRVQGDGLQKKQPAYLVLDATNKHAIVGSMSLGGQAVDIGIVKGKAYVVSPTEGVNIFDLSDPVNPESVGHLSGRTSGWHADVDEKILYLSALMHGVWVLNLEKFGFRSTLIDTLGSAVSSVHRNHDLFVANGINGVSIYDISAPISDKKIGQVTLPGRTTQLAFFDRFLVAVSNSGGLHLLDISNKTHPRIIQTIQPQMKYERVTVVDQYLYVSDGDFEVDVFTLNQGRLQKETSFQTFGNVRDFLHAGKFLYVSESSFGVSKHDVSNPGHPRRVGFVGVPGDPSGLSLYQKYLYVASGSQGVQILDTTLMESRKTIAALDTPADALDLVVDGDWIYIADGKSGLQIIDRSDLEHLTLVASLPTEYRVKSLVKSKKFLYLLLENKSLLVVDVSDPRSPKKKNVLNLEFRISALAVRGETLFAGAFNRKLLTIDISSPTQPWVSQVLDLPGRIRGISLRGDYVFMAADKAGLLVAIFKPGQPGRLVATLKRPWPMSAFSDALGIAVHGRYAYLVLGEEGVLIIDIEHPEDPQEVASFYHSGRSMGIELTDKYAVLSTRWAGYFFINIADPETPYLAAHMDSLRSTGGFKIEGDKLYAACRTTGMSVLPLPLRNLSAQEGTGLTLTFPKPQLSGWYNLSLGGDKKGGSVVAAVKID